MAMHKAKKIRAGRYEYRGFHLKRGDNGQWAIWKRDDASVKMQTETYAAAKAEVDYLLENNFHEVTNLMTGKKVMERMDTPFHCSVASESYWCS